MKPLQAAAAGSVRTYVRWMDGWMDGSPPMQKVSSSNAHRAQPVGPGLPAHLSTPTQSQRLHK
jgi:hypothetical protein